MNLTGFGIFMLALLQTVFGQFSSGGPSTFGYDASSACSKPYSRSSRAHYEKLPCDFRRQNWCTVAGSSYPWQAVRRFVHENQGLMRRMYGDEKHINVLKTELEKNDIELEYEERYKRHFDESWYSTYEDDNSFVGPDDEKSPEYEGRGFTSDSPELREFTRPHFRPTETTITTTIQTSTESSLPSSAGATSPTAPVTPPSADEPEESTVKTPTITLSEIARVKNSSLNEIPGLVGAKDVVSERTVTEAANGTELFSVDTTLEPKATSVTSTAPAIERVDQVFQDEEDDLSIEDSDEKQFRPRPEYRPGETKPDGSSIEGQLFQDVAAKDQLKHPVLQFPGVNACPVKEEIVAPFWANNTRGEVLALLNLYPFEQYVHWEKCTHENKQMYCRQGCKCEQQYRLHRLLAYDPNNECRGIFSDWFKFPSCCVCRCYDLPIEFRVTSRSPRVRKQRVKLRPPGGRWKP